MAGTDFDYLEDVFSEEYLPDDSSDYKNERKEDLHAPSVFNGKNIILPDWGKN